MLIVFLFALFLRIFLLEYGNHIDLIINTEWGLKIFEKGPLGFYVDRVWIYGWPTQFPLMNLVYGYNMYQFERILWHLSYFREVIITHHFYPDLFKRYFDFVYWFGTENYKYTPYKNGQIISMKIIPILSDLFIALLIFFLSVKNRVQKQGLAILIVFLFIPFSWYLSSLWGQYDQFSSLLTVTSLLLFHFSTREEKLPHALLLKIVSLTLFFVACSVKPTNMILGIIFLALFIKEKYKFISALSIFAPLSMFVATNKVFANSVSWYLFREDILPRVLNSDRFGLVNRAFNIWQFLYPNGGWANATKLLGVATIYWGIAFLVAILFVAIRVLYKDHSIKNLLVSIFIISGGAYIFSTGMVDRYFYTAIITLSLLCIYFPKLIYLWIIAGLIFSFNLYYSWGFPFLPEHLVWKSNLMIRIMSLLQAFVYVVTTIKVIKLVKVK